ncbi:MAG: hypothetical protein ACKN9T_16475 [Candidatus Methylumidiphilus sp.]
MSTNNPSITGLSAPAADASPAALGLPDAALIAQLANALFTSLPGRPTVPAVAADAQAVPPTSALPTAPPAGPEGELQSLPAAPYASPTSGFTPPSDAELRSAPASLASLGGTAPPATAATPSDEALPYFLDPAQPGLPGTAVGLGPASAARVESGAMPTAPSPPSAFAQPAEPSPRLLSALPDGVPARTQPDANAPASLPYSFRPEVVAAPIGGGGVTPQVAAPVTAPAPAAGVAETAAAAPGSGGGLPSGEDLTPSLPLPTNAPTETPFYFLDGAPPSPINAPPTLDFDPFGLPGALELAFGAFPFDARTADATPTTPGLGEYKP